MSELLWSDAVKAASRQLTLLGIVPANDFIFRQILWLADVLKQVEHDAGPAVMPSITDLESAREFFNTVRHGTHAARLRKIRDNPVRHVIESLYRLRTGNVVRPRPYQQVRRPDDGPLADREWIEEKNRADEADDLRLARKKR